MAALKRFRLILDTVPAIDLIKFTLCSVTQLQEKEKNALQFEALKFPLQFAAFHEVQALYDPEQYGDQVGKGPLQQLALQVPGDEQFCPALQTLLGPQQNPNGGLKLPLLALLKVLQDQALQAFHAEQGLKPPQHTVPKAQFPIELMQFCPPEQV